MSAIEQVLLAFQALRYTVAQLFRPRLWLWVVPLAAAELAVLALISGAAHPAVSWFMAPLLTRIAGDGALHYPGTFEQLPRIFRGVDVVLGAVLGAIGVGAATPVFAARFRGRPVEARRALGDAFRRSFDLIVVLLPLNLLVEVVSVAVASGAAGGGLRGRMLPLLGTTVTLAVQAATFYAAARVMLEGRPALAALRSLPATWRPGFLPAMVVGIVTLLVLIPLQLPGVTVRLLVERGNPELIAAWTLLRVAAGWLGAFLLTGAATLLYLGAVRPAERES